MNRIAYLFLTAILVGTVAHAQPVLLASEHNLQAGDTLFRQILPTFNYVPSPSGANQVFDYTNIPFPTVSMHAPFTIDSVHAGALIVAMANGNYTTTESYWMQADSLSSFGRSTDATSSFQLDDPALELPFPFSYGDVTLDQYSGEFTDGSTILPLTGRLRVEATAYGTLLLGFDAFTNVTMVYTLDSMDMGFPGNTTLVVRECYDYYHSTQKLPLLTACIETGHANYATWTNDVHSPAAVGLGQTIENKLTVYPNPFGSQITVLDAPKGNLQLLDLQGRCVFQEVLSKGDAVVQFPTLPKGAYHLVVESKAGRLHQMLLHE